MRPVAFVFVLLAFAALAGAARAAEPEVEDLGVQVEQKSPATINCGDVRNCYACTEAAICEWCAMPAAV
eukprot:tig00021719_g23166.t1